MGKGKPVIDYKSCMACGVCVTACPFSCMDLSKIDVDKYKKAYPHLTLKEKCSGCGICASSCPIGAVALVPES